MGYKDQSTLLVSWASIKINLRIPSIYVSTVIPKPVSPTSSGNEAHAYPSISDCTIERGLTLDRSRAPSQKHVSRRWWARTALGGLNLCSKNPGLGTTLISGTSALW